ncbi:MAG: VanW family protein [Firmicutes bacterium]|nr:VanW family protein [Bacillota bacterium]
MARRGWWAASVAAAALAAGALLWALHAPARLDGAVDRAARAPSAPGAGAGGPAAAAPGPGSAAGAAAGSGSGAAGAAEAHGVFIPDDTALSQRLQELGLSYLMGAYTTDFSHATPSQADNIALAARRLNGTVVPPGAIFSYNRTVGPYTRANGFGMGRMFVGARIVPSIGGGVCQGASTLYNAVVLADLEVVERHAHGLTVPYLPPGQDATVTDTYGLDFRFRNDTQAPVLIRAAAEDRKLTIAIYGAERPPQVTWRHEILATYPKTVEFTTDPDLPSGIRKTVAAGQDGVTVHSWLIIHRPEGDEIRDLGIDTYRPSPQVVAAGP